MLLNEFDKLCAVAKLKGLKTFLELAEYLTARKTNAMQDISPNIGYWQGVTFTPAHMSINDRQMSFWHKIGA
ncbi:MAG: hypothetical protein FWC80_04435 [Firmicutes bacterium]|nr:hypothetical protein [Bacillota bacterium]